MPCPLDQRVQDAFLKRFVESEAARVIAAESQKRGFGEMRVDSITPHIILIAHAGDEKALAEFGAWASATAGVGIQVKPLSSYPAWRRRATWEGASPVSPRNAQ